mmetsp:Transcript_93341/g.263947  ORF Transcript_93341/g.263947 Transcript_93341/m.263947 type:complete len:637 (+) Transcript_93341:3-1913(+)
MTHHMLGCVPIMLFLLWYNTGSLCRAATSFICLFCSYVGTHAATVVAKWCVAELNFHGPDQTVMFIELALCLDYCLFFWSRFVQERGRRPGPERYQEALMVTLQTSGAVIIVSVVVLVIGYAGMCFYPDQNTVGCLASNLQLIVGINLLGAYSLVVPASLASQFPSLFDEAKAPPRWPALDTGLQKVRSACGRALAGFSGFVTRPPWLCLLPLLVFACFVPLVLEIRAFKPNFDMFDAAASRTVVEHDAFQVLKGKFNLGLVEPVVVLLRAEPLGPAQPQDATALLQLLVAGPGAGAEASEAAQAALATAGAVSSSPQFREMTCAYVRSVLTGTRGREFQVGARDVQSVWWNASSGDCASGAMTEGREGFISRDGLSQVLKLFPPVHGTSLGAQAMTHFFWDQVEPRASRVFDLNGQRYVFQARHYTTLATIMLMQGKFAERAPWILVTLVAVICAVVGLLFSSVGIGLKMVLTVIVPIMAEFGLVVGIFQDGWLDWAGLHPTGGLLWIHFYTGMGLLLGLAIDYDIFLFARVFERRKQGFDNTSAVRMAVIETSPVINIAGTVMCLSFFFVAQSDIFYVSQLGVLYFFGVAIDTYIVRTLLAPAVLCVSETMNYWPGNVPKATLSWDGDAKTLGW